VERQADEAARTALLQPLLGYLNFSEGRPDPRFQKGINDLCAAVAAAGEAEPWRRLHASLRDALEQLRATSSTFREATQAAAVLTLVFDRLLPAYRRHHADLLFHQADGDLFAPFFIARACEAVLAQAGPWDEEPRIIEGALRQLNDFVGHRPVAILETRPRGEPYDHERVRPIPLYLRGAGAACGRYHDLVTRGLEVLAQSDPGLLAEAAFALDLLDELAVDPRAYDFGHPVNRRPNYLFGEWDPHHIDNQGRYRRYVSRQVTLDALLDRVANPGPLDRGEVLVEAAVAFAGTLLMATATSGSGPAAHDSSTTLTALLPRIARLRDAFYEQALPKFAASDAHATRLREEAAALRQPFGGTRQHLNGFLTAVRARQLQQRHLALLLAEMGYPEASRDEAARIPAVSLRLLSDILGRLATGAVLIERGELPGAAWLGEIEALLQRGIDCGAFADPWNVLGFQGLFPIGTAREDAVRDHRIHELVGLVERLLALHARLLSEAAARGEKDLVASVLPQMKRLAAWWDRFATTTVGEVRPVLGSAAVESARHVTTALADWHERGQASADLAFWRDRLEGFRSPKAFALVVAALLGKRDYRAAMGLLISWLGQVEQVPLTDGVHSFDALALQWMLGVAATAEAWPLSRRFLDLLEANAEEYWQVPSLDTSVAAEAPDAEDDLYEAAYEGVTYRDTTDDSEGAVADGGEPHDEFVLEGEGERLTSRLHFLTTVARLWHIAARRSAAGAAAAERQETVARWRDIARENRRRLRELLEAVHACPIPEPSGEFDALVAYDRRRLLKEQLLHTIIGTCLETELAVGALEGLLGVEGVPEAILAAELPYAAAWGPAALRLEQAIQNREPASVRAVLPAFLERFQDEPLLFTPLSQGGEPRQVLRVRLAQAIVRALVTILPRLGLLRETFHVLRTARAMELAHPAEGRGVTQFNEFFEAAFRGVAECLVASAATWGPDHGSDDELVDLLDAVATSFMALWIDHARVLRLSVLEQVQTAEQCQALEEFIRRYGRDLFDVRFLALANLRGILHRGIGDYLDYLRDNPDPLHPIRLVEELDRTIARPEAIAWLEIILQAVVENYEEYRDFNTTAAAAAYGDNLYVLLDFLQLKASYVRHAWQLRPLVLAHEVLARKGRTEAAVLWQEQFAELTQELAAEHLESLAECERAHRVRLGTVADRIQERFVRPLALDRLCALIEPAMAEARAAGERPAFARLRRELQPFAATPTGVGLDVPEWLRRLEAEVQQVRLRQTAVVELAEGLFLVPQRVVPYEEMQQQIQGWDKPV
jgi:hypothetical protein